MPECCAGTFSKPLEILENDLQAWSYLRQHFFDGADSITLHSSPTIIDSINRVAKRSVGHYIFHDLFTGGVYHHIPSSSQNLKLSRKLTDPNPSGSAPSIVYGIYLGFIEGIYHPDYQDVNLSDLQINIRLEDQQSMIDAVAHSGSDFEYRMQAITSSDGTFSSFRRDGEDLTGISGTFYGPGVENDSAIIGKLITPYGFGTYLVDH